MNSTKQLWGMQYNSMKAVNKNSLPDVMRQVEGQIMLRILDQRWRDHLYSMDYLKEGIHLRAMGQKNPLTEWQREGFEMFETMMDSVSEDFVKYVSHIEISDNPKTDNENYSRPISKCAVLGYRRNSVRCTRCDQFK